MAIKNFWSLEAGEAIVCDWLRKKLGKSYQTFVPLDNQLKDFDLLLLNKESKNAATIQVKESREYHPGRGDGLYIVSAPKVEEKVADFYVLVMHAITEKNENSLKIDQRYLVIPGSDLLKKSKIKVKVNSKSKRNLDYYYHMKIQRTRAFDDREKKEVGNIDFSEYLNRHDLLEI